MTVKVYGVAKFSCDYKDETLTKGKEYPIVKISYNKYNPEGLVTIIDDKKRLVRMTSYHFEFIVK